MLSVTVCTIGYVCLFRGDQIFVDIVTVNGERFAGLNVRVFNTIEVFVEILLRCLGRKCLLFSIIKDRHLYSQENFHGTLENRKKRKCLRWLGTIHVWLHHKIKMLVSAKHYQQVT